MGRQAHACRPSGASSKELLLIGTVHNDPQGAVRLFELLRKERPSEVLVEVSPYGLSFRQRNGRRLRRILGRRLRHLTRGQNVGWKAWGQIRSIFLQMDMPFEYRASLKYCRESGAGLSCIDLSSQSREFIEGWHELLGTRNLRTLLGKPPEELQEMTAKACSLAARLLAERDPSRITPYLHAWLKDPDLTIREAHLAAQVSNLYGRMVYGRIAYVGGWQHLLHPTDAGTLCDRLAHLRPRKILLH
jgi:hypothetical protein